MSVTFATTPLDLILMGSGRPPQVPGVAAEPHGDHTGGECRVTGPVARTPASGPRIRIVGASGDHLDELRRMLAPLDPQLDIQPSLDRWSDVRSGDTDTLHIVDLRPTGGRDHVDALRDHGRDIRTSAPILVIIDREDVEREVLRGYRIVGTLEAMVAPLRLEAVLLKVTTILRLVHQRSSARSRVTGVAHHAFDLP